MRFCACIIGYGNGKKRLAKATEQNYYLFSRKQKEIFDKNKQKIETESNGKTIEDFRRLKQTSCDVEVKRKLRQSWKFLLCFAEEEF